MSEREIFLALLDLPDPAARAQFLRLACGDDPARRTQIEALLRSHDTAGSFLGSPAVPPPERVMSGTHEFSSAATSEESANEADDGLAFLAPSARPDGLGRIGHYEVFEVLGRGGFGIVLRAFDDTLQRVVAVKVLAPWLATTPPPRKRFLREARSSAKVRHENVVRVYAVEERPLPYLVMEFIPGETLQQRLDRTGPLETEEAVRIGRQIAEGLAAAHAQGLIHRDIKPANILIESGPRPCAKITDFGLARAADDASLTQSGFLAGTPLFMAPEQARGDPLDHRADLFSLGSVLYTICSGRPPFRASGTLAVLKRVAEDTPRPIKEINPGVPQWLCDLISRLHAKKPDERFATAREVADLLARHLAQMRQTGIAPPTSDVSPASAEIPVRVIPEGTPVVRSPSGTGLWAAAAALVLLGGVVLTEAIGVTNVRGTVIRLFSPEGTLVVEVDDPAVSVRIDGSELVITGAGAREIRLRPGRYTVEASKHGKVVRRELVAVTKDGRQVVRVSQEASPTDAKAGKDAAGAAWERSVAALPAGEQAEAVGARLRQLNPGFDGKVEQTIENGAVVGLKFASDRVSDLSPVRALTGLRCLTCRSVEFNGALIDLSPLSRLPLEYLDCVNNRVHDLTPLEGMKLTTLHCDTTKVTDLSPLRGMPLKELSCSFTKVADLAALEGMKLTTFDCAFSEVDDLTPLMGMPLTRLHCGFTKVADLAPLKGMKLRSLDFGKTKVTDLSPLKGMRLEALYFTDTKVTHLSPLKGMPMKDLYIGELVTDLSPIEGMPLDRFSFAAFQADRDAKALRAVTTLRVINSKPAAQFWKEVGVKVEDR